MFIHSLESLLLCFLWYIVDKEKEKRDLDVNKSWFFIGDAIVCIGSDITSSTVVLYHLLFENKICFLSINWKEFLCNELKQNNVCNWLETMIIKSDIDIILPKGLNVNAIFENRKGTYNNVEIIENNVYDNDLDNWCNKTKKYWLFFTFYFLVLIWNNSLCY